jgi:hypothetical protein
MPQSLKNLFKRVRVSLFGFWVGDLLVFTDSTCVVLDWCLGDCCLVVPSDYTHLILLKNLRTGKTGYWENNNEFFDLYKKCANFNRSEKEVKYMKLRIYDAAAASRNGHLTGIVRIRLIRDNPQTIGLYAVNHLGEKVSQGGLLKINADGSIVRCAGVNTSLGLNLEAPGKLSIS